MIVLNHTVIRAYQIYRIVIVFFLSTSRRNSMAMEEGAGGCTGEGEARPPLGG
jgi:hypothetical protein